MDFNSKAIAMLPSGEVTVRGPEANPATVTLETKTRAKTIEKQILRNMFYLLSFDKSERVAEKPI